MYNMPKKMKEKAQCVNISSSFSPLCPCGVPARDDNQLPGDAAGAGWVCTSWSPFGLPKSSPEQGARAPSRTGGTAAFSRVWG